MNKITSLFLFVYLLVLSILIDGDSVAQVILPGDGFAPGWRKQGTPTVFHSKNLYGHINGGAELFLEFGFSKLVVQRYRCGAREVSLDAYKMAGADAALAIYLAKKGIEQPLAGVTVRHTGGDYQITALKGRYFVQVNNQSGEADNLADMIQLLQQFLQPIAAESLTVRWDDFPEARLPGSELLLAGPYSLQMVYTLGEGDVLQLAGNAFARCAQISAACESTYTLIHAAYRDSAEARSVLHNLSAHLDAYLQKIEVSADTLTFRDYKNEYGRVVRRGATLEIALHLASIGVGANQDN